MYNIFPKKFSFDKINQDILKNFDQKTAIIFPYKKDDHILNKIDIVLIQEDYHKHIELPSSIIRVGLPHGTDINIRTSIVKYGMWSYCDYIFAHSKFKTEDIKDIQIPLHQKFISHKSKDLKIINGGFPKLDEFINKADRVKDLKNKIIYSISRHDVESKLCIKSIPKTISYLCENFKNYEIVFRPDPHVELPNKISSRISSLKSSHSFRISKTLDYTEEYSDALILITSRPSSGLNYVFATKRPIICFDQSMRIIKNDSFSFGFLVSNLNDLNKAINNTINITKDSKNFEFPELYNPGYSVKYFVNNLNFILSRGINPEWKSLQLNPNDSDIDDYLSNFVSVHSINHFNTIKILSESSCFNTISKVIELNLFEILFNKEGIKLIRLNSCIMDLKNKLTDYADCKNYVKIIYIFYTFILLKLFIVNKEFIKDSLTTYIYLILFSMKKFHFMVFPYFFSLFFSYALMFFKSKVFRIL